MAGEGIGPIHRFLLGPEPRWAPSSPQELERVGRLRDPAWIQAIAGAAVAVDRQCRGLAGAYGTALGGIEPPLLRWALGQVVSRAFGGQEQLGLAPFIDLCNHQADFLPPSGGKDAETGEDAALVHLPRDLAAGEEVFISYIAREAPEASRARAALDAFLNFGFVPPELV